MNIQAEIQHKNLAQGRWWNLTFAQQMANIGSEVERAIIWKNKNNQEYSQKAFFRALELIDLSREKLKKSRLRELSRVREVLADYFMFDNQYGSTDQAWQKYFLSFCFAARNK